MGKIIAGLPVRNEEWILEKTLTDLSTYVDEIVIVDDGSTDNTPEIIRSFKKVTAIYTNPPGTLPFCNGQESINRNKVLELARKRGADWYLHLDADEVMEDRIKEELPSLLEIGCTTRFRICHLWNDIDHFRVDGEWGDFYRFRLYKMNRRLRYSPQPIIATPRAFDRKHKYTSDIKIVHYGWLDKRVRMRSLHRYWEVYKLKHSMPDLSFEEFRNNLEMQADLRIVSQNEEDVELKSWQEVMGNVSQEKFRI